VVLAHGTLNVYVGNTTEKPETRKPRCEEKVF